MLWFHVSDEFVGYNPVLEPRQIPGNSVFMFEGNVPRVCVSNNIYFCVRSKIGREDLRSYDLLFQFAVRKNDEDSITETDTCKIVTIKNPSVYATEETPYYPPNCNDFRRNNEMWFITPTQFQFIGFLSIDQIIKNMVIRYSPQQIETIYVPNEYKMNLELNPYMDCLYTNGSFFNKEGKSLQEQYKQDYGYEDFTLEDAENRLKELGVLK